VRIYSPLLYFTLLYFPLLYFTLFKTGGIFRKNSAIFEKKGDSPEISCLFFDYFILIKIRLLVDFSLKV